jgi:hypothetical protein
MTLTDWQNNGWLKPHKATKKQIADLFAIVERDLVAAQTEDLTADWKFGIAYNAALKLCTIVLYSSGYRPENALAHFRTIAALPLILGPKHKADADYLEACRIKRNKVEYDMIDQATPEQAAELVKFVIELRGDVREWMKGK